MMQLYVELSVCCVCDNCLVLMEAALVVACLL
jgi:hypothetical protein